MLHRIGSHMSHISKIIASSMFQRFRKKLNFDTFIATCARLPQYFNLLSEQMTELASIGGSFTRKTSRQSHTARQAQI